MNAYRLIKARLTDVQLDTFVTERDSDGGQLTSGPYQIVIGLLVIGTGAQSEGSKIMKKLASLDPRETFEEVVAQFRAQVQPDWQMAAQVIETLMRAQDSENVSDLRGWARKVDRFLLHGSYVEN